MTPEEEIDKMWAELAVEMDKYANECARVNDRILKAIKNQLGQEFYDLLIMIIDCSEVSQDYKYSIVQEPRGRFQHESEYGFIVGCWVDQWSTGTEGDSYSGYITVKLKDYKYLEMSFSC